MAKQTDSGPVDVDDPERNNDRGDGVDHDEGLGNDRENGRDPSDDDDDAFPDGLPELELREVTQEDFDTLAERLEGMGADAEHMDLGFLQGQEPWFVSGFFDFVDSVTDDELREMWASVETDGDDGEGHGSVDVDDPDRNNDRGDGPDHDEGLGNDREHGRDRDDDDDDAFPDGPPTGDGPLGDAGPSPFDGMPTPPTGDVPPTDAPPTDGAAPAPEVDDPVADIDFPAPEVVDVPTAEVVDVPVAEVVDIPATDAPSAIVVDIPTGTPDAPATTAEVSPTDDVELASALRIDDAEVALQVASPDVDDVAAVEEVPDPLVATEAPDESADFGSDAVPPAQIEPVLDVDDPDTGIDVALAPVPHEVAQSDPAEGIDLPEVGDFLTELIEDIVEPITDLVTE